MYICGHARNVTCQPVNLLFILAHSCTLNQLLNKTYINFSTKIINGLYNYSSKLQTRLYVYKPNSPFRERMTAPLTLKRMQSS